MSKSKTPQLNANGVLKSLSTRKPIKFQKKLSIQQDLFSTHLAGSFKRELENLLKKIKESAGIDVLENLALELRKKEAKSQEIAERHAGGYGKKIKGEGYKTIIEEDPDYVSYKELSLKIFKLKQVHDENTPGFHAKIQTLTAEMERHKEILCSKSFMQQRFKEYQQYLTEIVKLTPHIEYFYLAFVDSVNQAIQERLSNTRYDIYFNDRLEFEISTECEPHTPETIRNALSPLPENQLPKVSIRYLQFEQLPPKTKASLITILKRAFQKTYTNYSFSS